MRTATAVAPERSSKDSVVIEVLFSIGSESYTSRDLLIYKTVLGEVFQKNKISQFAKKTPEDFLLSRLSYKEAKVFELTNEKLKVSESARKKMNEFSLEEIDRENEIISVALELIEIKETQVKSQARFDTWFELLKRKYQIKLKSSEVK